MVKYFHIVDYEHLDFDFWRKFFKNHDLQYIFLGKEIGEKNGKKHIQGYLQFKKKKRLKSLYKLLPNTNIDPAYGSPEQNLKYCSKEQNIDREFKGILELGTKSQQGARKDLYALYDLIKEGFSIEDCMDYDFSLYCRYKNGIEKAIMINEKKNRKLFRKIDVEVISGPTGCGKTRKAMENEDVFKINNLKWFDGYDGEKTLLIDEYNNDVKITNMLSLLDGYQKRLEIKGGFTYANWDKIIITTNLKVCELHSNAKKEHRNALFRRITDIKSLWNKDNFEQEVIIGNNSNDSINLDFC